MLRSLEQQEQAEFLREAMSKEIKIPGISAMKGDKGDTGEQGIQGIQGQQGEQGIAGIDGKDGKRGLQGEKGDKGDKGERGEKGETGLTGAEGKSADIEALIEELKKGQHLEPKHIKGMPINMNDMRWHGGGISNITGLIQAGTNITLTGIGTSSSPYIINSSGSTSPLTTKGDLYTFTTVDARLGVGSNGQLLSADSTQPTGLKWIAAPATGLTVGITTISSGTTTRILYDNAGVLGEYTLTGTGTVVAMQTSPTFATSITGSYLNVSQILITDGSKNIISADTATYPSLTELSYVKGVTSAIQTQLNSKGSGTVTAVSVATANGFAGSSSGGATPALTLTTTINSPILAGNGTAISAATTTGTGSTAVLSASPALTGTPTAPTASIGDNTTQIATTAFVQTAVLTVPSKDAVKYASIAALPSIVYANGASGVGATLTGVALAAISLDGASPGVGDRVLIKNQVSTFQNGIYVVTQTGSGIAVFILTRAADFDQSQDVQTGANTFVLSGNTLANTTWSVNSASNPVMGTDAITFVQEASSAIVVGTTPVSNGTTGRVLYDNAGVVGEMTNTGTGTVNVLQTSPSLITPALGVATYTTLSGGNITDSGLTAGRITFAGTAGLLSDSANLTYAASGGLVVNNVYARFGTSLPFVALTTGVDIWGNDNTTSGVQITTGNRNSGTSAYNGYSLNNDLAVSGDITHFGFIGLNSSGYTDTTFGTAFAVANQMIIQNTDGPIIYVANKNSAAGVHQFFVRGTATTNEVGQFNNTGMTIGLTGTLTGAIKFAGATSTGITVQGVAAGLSGVNTLQAVTDTFVYKATTDTLTNKTLIATTNVVEEITTITDSATPTPTGGSLRNAFDVTALAQSATFAAPSGTPANWNRLLIRIKDNGTARALAWNAIYVAGGVALPSTTIISKILTLGFIYNTANALNKWMLVSVSQEL